MTHCTRATRNLTGCMVVLFLAAAGPATAADAPAYPEHQDLSYVLTATGDRHPIQTPADWELRRTHVLAQMQTVMGPLPRPGKPVPLGMEVLEETQEEGYVRKKVRYHTDSPDAWVHAWLLLPTGKGDGKIAAVLCLHQTTGIGKDEPAGLGGNPNLHYAKHLAARGFVALAPDYPSFGEYAYDFDADDYISGTMKAIYDNTRAIDLLQSLPQVDPARIGCIGHSLGGHNTMFTAAFDPRIKAAVSNCGFTRFHKYYEGKLKGWTSPRYMPLIDTRYGNDPDRVPFDFPEIIAAFAPRAFLAVSPIEDSNFEVSGVRDAIASARPIYKLLDVPANLDVIYPDCGHDFPKEARETAYRFLERHLAR